jgi:hypothetical protein
MPRFLSQGHAEDVILRHRYLYYVEDAPVLSDKEYDELEAQVKATWSIGVASHTVGSSDPANYPPYIVEGRRPLKAEREERDREIVSRWLRLL